MPGAGNRKGHGGRRRILGQCHQACLTADAKASGYRQRWEAWASSTPRRMAGLGRGTHHEVTISRTTKTSDILSQVKLSGAERPSQEPKTRRHPPFHARSSTASSATQQDAQTAEVLRVMAEISALHRQLSQVASAGSFEIASHHERTSAATATPRFPTDT